jgi:hypothetical protein
MTDLYMQYEKAGELERARIRRMMELRQMTPSDLSKQYESNAYDAKIIEQYWSNFSKEGQRAVGEVLKKKYDLPDAKLPGGGEDIPDRITESFSPRVANDFWDAWTERAKTALDFFRGQWESIANGTAPTLGENKKGEKSKEVGTGTEESRMYKKYITEGQPIPKGPIDVNVKADIELTLGEKGTEELAKEVGKAVEDKIIKDENVKKKLGRGFGDYIT